MELTNDSYSPNSRKLTQLFVAGFIASLIVLILSAVAEIFGYHPGIGELYGAMVNDQITPDKFSGTWWLGVTMYLALSAVVFPVLFDLLTDRQVLTSKRTTRGLVAGLAIWLVAELILKPIGGYGLFSSATLSPTLNVVVSLALCSLYGVLLENMTRVRVVHAIETERRAAA